MVWSPPHPGPQVQPEALNQHLLWVTWGSWVLGFSGLLPSTILQVVSQGPRGFLWPFPGLAELGQE